MWRNILLLCNHQLNLLHWNVTGHFDRIAFWLFHQKIEAVTFCTLHKAFHSAMYHVNVIWSHVVLFLMCKVKWYHLLSQQCHLVSASVSKQVGGGGLTNGEHVRPCQPRHHLPSPLSYQPLSYHFTILLSLSRILMTMLMMRGRWWPRPALI